MMNQSNPDQYNGSRSTDESESPITIQVDHGYAINPDLLLEAAAIVLHQQQVEKGSGLSIVITNDDEVQALNRQYRDIDAPTDILSFPADAVPEEIAAGEAPYLGDLVIAYPYTSQQAEGLGHDLSDTLALLVVHGTLHLLGYDHDTPENRAAMWAAQEEALRALSIPLDMLPPLEE
jgi:probable rRNA maturation factor